MVKEKGNKMVKEKLIEEDGLKELDNRSKKDTSGNKVINTTFMSNSVVYTLVDEALWAHRQRDILNMFDCVNALFYMIRDIPSKSNGTDVIGKRIVNILTSVDTKDCDGVIVRVPAYNLMRAASYYSGYCGKWVIDLVDCDDNKIHIYAHDLFQVNDYIGRVLMISVFELLQSKDLYLPEELYLARRKIERTED
jgi:hypothetical protein